MDFKDYQAQSKSHWIKRNPISSAAIALMVLAGAANYSTISQNMQATGRVREKAMEHSEFNQQLQATSLFVEQQAEIAEQRYSEGCVLVVASNDPTKFTSLTEGQPVLDSVRNVPLPAGTVVCDVFGNTARIVSLDGQPVASEFAYTGNKQLVDDAIAASNAADAEINQPNIE
ncbi:hypothetical protein H6F88_01940 [Oculatella sp. FACHB-28]|uniref:hypothetical protein n=1 Tax=Oculatella sp. FACHB-28 TaxID=2692845 RepID=UPI001688F3B4|nr:hypothetical protein [Oculatella sp. FACHB-28]MBD2054795.1 hypothetical protein [Oculatella sp. FACHB-28]